MKVYAYGLALGLILSAIITFTNVILPQNGPDSSPGMLVVATVIGSFVVWSAYDANKRAKDHKLAIKVGIATSVIGFLIAMLTFVIIDNLFLDIVSRQADKILELHRNPGKSMRELINQGLIRGIILGTPASAIFGTVCGFLSSKL